MHVPPDTVCKLNKAVYGLVQAAREFYRRLVSYLIKKRDFKVSSTEPCLVCKGSGSTIVIIGIYVDNLLAIGPHQLLQREIEAIRDEFDVRVKDKVDEYVGCQIITNEKVTFYINHG